MDSGAFHPSKRDEETKTLTFTLCQYNSSLPKWCNSAYLGQCERKINNRCLDKYREENGLAKTVDVDPKQYWTVRIIKATGSQWRDRMKAIYGVNWMNHNKFVPVWQRSAVTDQKENDEDGDTDVIMQDEE